MTNEYGVSAPGADTIPKRLEPLPKLYTCHRIIIIPWGKGGRCVGLTTLPHSCADCPEIWEPQPPGTLWACSDL
jgi:hypothetical protein